MLNDEKKENNQRNRNFPKEVTYNTISLPKLVHSLGIIFILSPMLAKELSVYSECIRFQEKLSLHFPFVLFFNGDQRFKNLRFIPLCINIFLQDILLQRLALSA